MRSSDVDICNMALANIGGASFLSINDQGKSPDACRLRFEESRLQTLSACLWNFASMWAKGVRLDVTPKPPFRFAYAYPADALKLFEILRDNPADPKIPYEVTDNPEGNGKLINTDHEAPVFVYNRDKTDPSDFSIEFREAMAWLLASKIAMPVVKDMKKQQEAYKMFVLATSTAVTANANESGRDMDITPSYQEVR